MHGEAPTPASASAALTQATALHQSRSPVSSFVDMSELTVIGFASGSPQSEAAMLRVARDHRLAAVVVPQQRGGLSESVRCTFATRGKSACAPQRCPSSIWRRSARNFGRI